MLRKLLESSRYLLVLPVIGSLLLTAAVVIVGLGTIVAQVWKLFESGEFGAKAAKQLTLTVIQTIDMFLVGAISYIVAVGIYKLFISQADEQLLKGIRIEKLDDLENKIIGVVVVALAVGFLGKAEEAVDMQALLQGGVGIAVVIGALCLFLKFSGSSSEK
jgi:uncharacterized membrane protein YqhA